MSESRTMPLIEETGLTQGEVIALRESGLDNVVKASTSRSLIDIVRANVFTLFNGIIFAAMVMVLITGSWRDAVFGMIIIINTGIGICTELKAKRTLDKLSILVASDYLVHRDGKDVEIPHNDIVLGDFMWIRSGEQVPADAQIVHTWGLELDESMLTGESRTVRKGEGCDIFSGSTAISGMALVKGHRRRRAQLRGQTYRTGEGLQENRIRPKQGHQHDSEIHDLPGGAALRTAHLVAGTHCWRLECGHFDRRMAFRGHFRSGRCGRYDP